MTDKAKMAKVLKVAIKGEEDGYKFYNLLAERATNDEARRKLENLRNDEMQHKQVLYDLYEKHIGGEVGELPEHGLNALAEVFKKGRLEELKSEQEFINLAIEAELAATQYYQDQMESSDDADFRAIFDRLAAEEHGHYQLLMAERESLGGNYHWFSYGEGSPLED
ncbi:MAG: ferritin family protein [bacterium]